jgi:hypothetical protein
VFWASVPFSLAAVVIGWLVIPQTADRGFDWRRAMRPPLACNSSSCVNPAVTRANPTRPEQARWFGPDTPVREWHKRLVCSQCGSREIDFVLSGARR